MKTKVDLGCNFYCQANIEDPSRIFVEIGLGFYLELTLDEAEKFVNTKVLAVLQAKQVSEANLRSEQGGINFTPFVLSLPFAKKKKKKIKIKFPIWMGVNSKMSVCMSVCM